MVCNADGGTSYHCFNCNFKANYTPGRHLNYKFRKLLSWLGASENEVKRLVIEAVRVKDLVAPTETFVEEARAEVYFKPRPLPAEAMNFVGWESFYTLQAENPEVYNVPADFHNAVMYAVGRDIDIIKYDLQWTPETQNNLNIHDAKYCALGLQD